MATNQAYPCYSQGMSEKEIQFLEALKAHFQDSLFTPLDAMEPFQLSQLPESVRAYLVLHGPGIGASKAMARWLKSAGAQRATVAKTRRGFLWVLPS
jgi:hypothetical protein